MPAATLSRSMGRKRKPKHDLPDTPRGRFAAHLRKLAGDRMSKDLAREWGVSPAVVSKWLNGLQMPDLAVWPKIAKTFGIKDYRQILPPRI